MAKPVLIGSEGVLGSQLSGRSRNRNEKQRSCPALTINAFAASKQTVEQSDVY